MTVGARARLTSPPPGLAASIGAGSRSETISLWKSLRLLPGVDDWWGEGGGTPFIKCLSCQPCVIMLTVASPSEGCTDKETSPSDVGDDSSRFIVLNAGMLSSSDDDDVLDVMLEP